MHNHEKIDIDPEEWPKNYWDEALYCEPCEIHWPSSPHFAVCPQCEFETKQKANPPDMRWPEAVKIFLEEKFENFYRDWRIERATETLNTFEKIVEAA